MLHLPRVPQFIKGAIAQHLNARTAELERWAALVHEREQDVEVGPGAKIILTSPDGKRWALTVSNLGALVVTPEVLAIRRRRSGGI